MVDEVKGTRVTVSRGLGHVAELFALVPENDLEAQRGVIPFGPGVPMVFPNASAITMVETGWPLGVCFLRATGIPGRALVIATAIAPAHSGVVQCPEADHVLEYPPDLDVRIGDFVTLVRAEAIA